jgi:hypothetical protein
LKENKKTDEKLESEQDSRNKISRRDFLKYGVGAAAVAAGATALMGRLPLPTSEAPKAPAPSVSDAIIVAVHGDELTVMRGNAEVIVKDSALAGALAGKVR